jgi:hypothetical protein
MSLPAKLPLLRSVALGVILASVLLSCPADPPDDGALVVQAKVTDIAQGELVGTNSITFKTSRIDVVHRTAAQDPTTEKTITVDTQSRTLTLDLQKGLVEQLAILPVSPGFVLEVRFVTQDVSADVAGHATVIKLPSGEQSGLKILAPEGNPFPIQRKSRTVIQANFNPNHQLNKNNGQGLIMKPTVQADLIATPNAPNTGVTPDRVVIKFKPNTSRDAISQAVAAKSATVFQEGPDLLFILSLSYPQTISDALDYYNSQSNIIFASPDFYEIDRGPLPTSILPVLRGIDPLLLRGIDPGGLPCATA